MAQAERAQVTTKKHTTKGILKTTESINHGVQGKELKANIAKRHNESDAG